MQTARKLEHYWMPFTDNARFKAAPKFIGSAKDMYYTTSDGRQVLDGLATLWCVNAGHCRPRIVEAIAPPGLSQVFFTNSGSEAVDTVLKIAIAYHRLRGEGSRTRFIGRERAYH